MLDGSKEQRVMVKL